MADEIHFENGRISNFQSHVTLTLDWAGLMVYRRASPTYQILFESEKLFVDGRTYIHRGRLY